MWLARRMKEVGDWKEDRRGGGPDENKNTGLKTQTSLGGVVGRAAPNARRAENRDGRETSQNDSKNESQNESKNESKNVPLSSFPPHRRNLRHLQTVSSLSSVTFTVTPSPFHQIRKERNLARGGWRAAKDAEDADEDLFARETSTRVDDVFAADAAAWDVADRESDGDDDHAERAMLHSLRAARARR